MTISTLTFRWVVSPLAILTALACGGPAEGADTGTDTGTDAATPDAALPDGGGNDAAPSVDANVDAFAYVDGGIATDPNYGERQACTFVGGADPNDTVGTPAVIAAARGAIEHVIVIMQENRSLDHMFGVNTHGWEGFPTGFTNPDGAGGTVAPFHATDYCLPDPDHQWTAIHSEWHDGAMDGFVTTNGMGSMAYYAESDHPFYTWMLSTFATSDRYFCDVLSGTWPNRDYLYAGTSAGVMNTAQMGGPAVTIFDRLEHATTPITWGDYVEANPLHECLEGSLGGTYNPPSAATGFCAKAGVHPYDDLAPLLAAGTNVPAVVYVDLEPDDDHPANGDLRSGEAAVHTLMTQIFNSPIWAHTAVFFTYDEAGGFFDHVAPPTACIATPTQTMFDHLGMRVPVAVVSPYARPAYNSRLTHSHTSILRFIETIYDLPALTARDANADAMLDMFDFSTPTFSTVTGVVAPMPLGSGCH